MITSTICLKCKYYKKLTPSECSKYCEKCHKPEELEKKMKNAKILKIRVFTQKVKYFCSKCESDKVHRIKGKHQIFCRNCGTISKL